EPVTCVPVIRGAEYKHDPIVMAVPPTLVVPLWRVVPENSITCTLPVLASFNAFALLELHRRRLCGVWLFGNIEVLRLNRFARCSLTLGHPISCLCCGGRLTAFASFLYFSPFRCLPFDLGLILLALLAFGSGRYVLSLLSLSALFSARVVLV